MNYTTVLIAIHYLANENKVHRQGMFELKGRKREETAWEFWKWIKREHPWEVELEKVICEGEDITELVLKQEKAPLD